MITGTNTEPQSKQKRVSSVTDDYPNEDPSEYEDNPCGRYKRCDLLSGYSGGKGHYLLRVLFSWAGVRTAQYDLLLYNLTDH